MSDTNTASQSKRAGGAKAAKDWQCNECGHRMTAARAFSAMYRISSGCPKCGGMDIDLAPDAVSK